MQRLFFIILSAVLLHNTAQASERVENVIGIGCYNTDARGKFYVVKVEQARSNGRRNVLFEEVVHSCAPYPDSLTKFAKTDFDKEYKIFVKVMEVNEVTQKVREFQPNFIGKHDKKSPFTTVKRKVRISTAVYEEFLNFIYIDLKESRVNAFYDLQKKQISISKQSTSISGEKSQDIKKSILSFSINRHSAQDKFYIVTLMGYDNNYNTNVLYEKLLNSCADRNGAKAKHTIAINLNLLRYRRIKVQSIEFINQENSYKFQKYFMMQKDKSTNQADIFNCNVSNRGKTNTLYLSGIIVDLENNQWEASYSDLYPKD